MASNRPRLASQVERQLKQIITAGLLDTMLRSPAIALRFAAVFLLRQLYNACAAL